jgi:hypothetical protein
MIYFIILSILFIILNVIDWYLSKRAVDRGGTELNPIPKKFGLGTIKLIACPLFIAAGYFLHWLILIIPNALMLAACIWNYVQLKKG